MFRVGKNSKTDAAEQPQPAHARDEFRQQQQAQSQAPHAQPAPPPARPQPVAPTPAGTRPAQPAATTPPQQQQQGASAPQAQQPQQQPSSVSRAVSESESLARAVKEGAVGGFVGGTSALAGEINFRGMMRVDGRVTGRVVSADGTLIVSAGGRVEAEVAVAVAKISGEVEGDITATGRVELGRTARVTGNIQTPALVIEEGAIFDGNCLMSRRRENRAGDAGARESKTAA